MMAKKKNELEENFSRLEKITEELGREDLDLEDALSKFESGLALAEKLKKRLSEIENKIETIKIKFEKPSKDGEVV